MLPAQLDDDEQIRGGDAPDVDAWTFRLDLDPARDWSASTFTVDAVSADAHGEPVDVEIEADDTHTADEAPYVVLRVEPAVTRDLPTDSFRWRLGETPILNRTFLTQIVRLRPR